MLFWIIAAVMTFAATAALVRPLRGERAVAPAAPDAAHDVEVYRDQLGEVARDRAAGLIGDGEAEVARAEIGRRLLAAARRTDAAAQPGPGTGRARLSAIFILLFLPLAALSAYVAFGSPGLPQQPLAERMAQDPEKADLAVLVASAERHLAANPDDGRGWDVLAPIYLRVGRVDEAEAAFRKAIALLGPSSARQSGLGEALIAKAGGVVTEEARLVFQSARELDSEDPRPAFFLALALAQSGKGAEARAAFEALIARSPPDAPWIAAVRQQLAALESAPAQPSAGMPSTAEVAAAAAGKTPAEQAEMARGMVASLEEKLKSDPADLDGWLMLIRSKAVLGDLPGAQSALNSAISAVPAGAGAAKLSALAVELGLKPGAGLGGVSVNEAASAAPTPPAAAAPAEPFIVPGSPAAPGNPSAAEIAAAESLSAEDRAAMIREMVASLDARLSEAPDNIEGWLRLVRSYHVLGDRAAAGDAYRRGAGHFSEGSAERRALADLAAELAIDTEDPQ